ncbi:MAG: MFS transporter [Cyanophyceae cyanobacterium]
MGNPDSVLVKATLLAISTLTVMAGATIAPSLPAMQEHFEAVDNVEYWVRLVLTVPALCIAVGAPVVGVLIDRFGRKPLLTAALVVYGLAGSSGLWLPTIGSILVGRALLGLSVAGVMIGATALIADYYQGSARGQFLGLQAAFMALGGVLFLTAGGFLADLNWRLPFAIYLAALLLLPGVRRILPEPEQTRVKHPVHSEEEPTTVAFGLIILTYGIALVTQIVFYLIPVQLPFYLKSLVNASASRSGLAIALTTLFSALSSWLYQRLKSRLSFISIYGIAFLNMALGYGLISLATDFTLVLPGLAIAGIGLGLVMPNMNNCLTYVTPSASRGRVLSGLTTCFFLGQFLSPLVTQPVSQIVGFGVTYAFAGLLMAILAAFALIFLLRS